MLGSKSYRVFGVLVDAVKWAQQRRHVIANFLYIHSAHALDAMYNHHCGCDFASRATSHVGLPPPFPTRDVTIRSSSRFTC